MAARWAVPDRIHRPTGLKGLGNSRSEPVRQPEHLPADAVTLTLVKDGDHRLSRPQDLDLLKRAIDMLFAQARERADQAATPTPTGQETPVPPSPQ